MRILKAQSEQQLYSRIMDARLKRESTETFTNMAEESPIFTKRSTVVDRDYIVVFADHKRYTQISNSVMAILALLLI
ncbi:MAG: hypothetical protein WA461_15720 [Nitrososphaeraceae archaeon]